METKRPRKFKCFPVKQILEAWRDPTPNISDYLPRRRITGTLYVFVPQEPTFPWDSKPCPTAAAYKRRCNLVFIVGNYADVDNLRRITGVEDIEVIPYKTAWFDIAYTRLSKAHNADTFYRNNYTFDKLFISLNNRIRDYRTHFVDTLFKYDLDGYVSFLQIDENTKKQFQYWKNPRILELQIKERNNINKYLYKLPNQWYRAPIHLISETFNTPLPNGDIDISEKTTYPLLLGKPFLVAGPVDFHKHLGDLGFELYTEIFDYSFDSIENYEQRVDAMLRMVSELQYESYYELYDQCFAKAKRNAQYSIDFMNRDRPQIINDMAKPLSKWITLDASVDNLSVSFKIP